MRRPLLIVWTVGSLLAGLVLLTAPSALAAGATRIVDSGFWWAGNTGVGTNVAPPDVERGQLLVEATPAGGTAVSAIRAELADGEGNPTLTLRVASDNGGDAAIILACQAGAGWTGSYSGRFDDAPQADCDGGSVQGQRSADGSTWAFPLGPLQFGDQFNVVLVPGSNPDTDATPPFRIVFDEPASTDIATVADAPPPAPTTPTIPTTVPAAPTSAGGSSSGSFSAPPAPAPARTSTFTPPTTSAPVGTFETAAPVQSPVAPALPADRLGQTATAPVLTAQSAPILPELDETDVGRLRLLGLLVLAMGSITGLFWWRNEHAVPLRAVVTGVDEAMLQQLQAASTHHDGGLGRFRRSREGKAPQLF